MTICLKFICFVLNFGWLYEFFQKVSSPKVALPAPKRAHRFVNVPLVNDDDAATASNPDGEAEASLFVDFLVA